MLIENYERHRAVSAEARAACVPVMRTVFVCDDSRTVRRVREALAAQAAALADSRAPALRRSAAATVDQVALCGSRAEVADGLARHREALRLTHLIARVQVPGAEPAEIEGALERLAELAAAL